MTVTTADINWNWAWALMDALSGTGLCHVVFSPGSRSTPLTLAALRHPHLTTHAVLDERSAGFFALGLIKATGQPVAVIATSGSAIANWFPAIVEADLAKLPLIALSADRPPELQDCGANQTMPQMGLFGQAVRYSQSLPPAEADLGWLPGLVHRLIERATGPLPGPVHLNCPFREPLIPANPPTLPCTDRGRFPLLASRMQADPVAMTRIQNLLDQGPGVIICGSDPLSQPSRAAILDLSQRLQVPVLADPLSGLRYGSDHIPHVMACPDQIARQSPPPPAWILRFGGMPVSKPLCRWLEQCRDVPQIVINPHPRNSDAITSGHHWLTACPSLVCPQINGPAATADWLNWFLPRDRAADQRAEQFCQAEHGFEGSALRQLIRHLPAGCPVFLGNSLTIRAADWFGGKSPQPLTIHGNRGLSGIDGNLSTAFGLAAAGGYGVAVMGDLTLLHDLTALAMGQSIPLVTLLLDNQGGGIFDHLPQATLPEFDHGWTMPPKVDFMAAAAAFGMAAHTTADPTEACQHVLQHLQQRRSALIRLTIDRSVSLSHCRTFFASCPE